MATSPPRQGSPEGELVGNFEQEGADFFDLPRQKKDSTVSLSENDANSPRGGGAAVDKQLSVDAPANGGAFDFDKAGKADEDFFAQLEYPVKKRSLSNGASFIQKQEEELQTPVEKLAVTASDLDSSGQRSSHSQEGRGTFTTTTTVDLQKRISRPSDETKSNTEESKSQEAPPKKMSDSSNPSLASKQERKTRTPAPENPVKEDIRAPPVRHQSVKLVPQEEGKKNSIEEKGKQNAMAKSQFIGKDGKNSLRRATADYDYLDKELAKIDEQELQKEKDIQAKIIEQVNMRKQSQTVSGVPVSTGSQQSIDIKLAPTDKPPLMRSNTMQVKGEKSNIVTSSQMMVRKTQMVQVMNKNTGQDFIKGQAFSARYQLKQTTQQSSLGFFTGLSTMVSKFFQTDKVEIRKLSHLPIVLLDKTFHIDNASKHSIDAQIALIAYSFEQKFWALLWFCYRREFRPLLQSDVEEVQIFLTTIGDNRPERQLKIGINNDIGWGCTIRVAQMMLSHALLRHHLQSYDLRTLCANEAAYMRVLTLMNDNADGAQGAFSIQNIVRMSLIYDKYPGEWHGPGSISHVIKDLNKLYSPKMDFQIVHFPDGMIYYDKIVKAGCRKPRKYLVELMKKSPKSDEEATTIQQTCLLFKKYILPNRFNTQTITEKPLFDQQANDDWNGATIVEPQLQKEELKIECEQISEEEEEVPVDFFGDDARREGRHEREKQQEKPQVNVQQDWRNGVLVLVSTRLGLRKVGTEYFGAVKTFFMQQLNCGIIGGRPKEAYYLVGMQEDNLIFLDPHNTLDAVPFDLNSIGKNHIAFHERIAKKIHYTKIDPTMTFCFYVRDHSDFQKLKRFLQQKKEFFHEDWIFSQMETKPDYFKKRYDAPRNVQSVFTKIPGQVDAAAEETKSAESKQKKRRKIHTLSDDESGGEQRAQRLVAAAVGTPNLDSDDEFDII